MVQSIEDYSLWNISNRINLRRGQTSTLYIRFPVFLRWVMHHVSMYFPRKTVFHFLPREKRSCFREKNTIFPDDTRKIMCRHGTEKTIFSESLKKISYIRVFFRKDCLSLSVQRVRSCFREKEKSSFPIIQERSYSSAIFLEIPSFQDVWKKIIWFSMQCKIKRTKLLMI